MGPLWMDPDYFKRERAHLDGLIRELQAEVDAQHARWLHRPDATWSTLDEMLAYVAPFSWWERLMWKLTKPR